MLTHSITYPPELDKKPDAEKVDFTLTGGTFTKSVQGSMAGEGCTFLAPTVTVPLQPDEYSIITFDRSSNEVTYSGIAEYHGESVDITVSGCNDPLNNFDLRHARGWRVVLRPARRGARGRPDRHRRQQRRRRDDPHLDDEQGPLA